MVSRSKPGSMSSRPSQLVALDLQRQVGEARRRWPSAEPRRSIEPSERPAASSARGRCRRARGRRGRRSRRCSRASRGSAARRGGRWGSRAGRRRATRRRPGRRRASKGDDLLRAEEGLARGHRQLAPGRRRRELLCGARPPRPRAASTASRRAATRRSPAGRRRLAEAEDRDDDVLGVQLEVDAVVELEGELRQPVAGRRRCRARRSQSRSGSQPAIPALADHALVEHAEPGDRLDRLAGRGDRRRASRRAARSPWTRGEPAGGVERAGEQGAGAGRFDQADAAVDDRLVDPAAVAEVEHRRLGQAADDLVGRGDDEVGAAAERVRGQVGVEVQVGAPGLVDDQRQAALVGDRRRGRRRRRRRRSRSARRPSPRPRPGSRRAPPPATRASGSGRCPAPGRSRARRSSAAGR